MGGTFHPWTWSRRMAGVESLRIVSNFQKDIERSRDRRSLGHHVRQTYVFSVWKAKIKILSASSSLTSRSRLSYDAFFHTNSRHFTPFGYSNICCGPLQGLRLYASLNSSGSVCSVTYSHPVHRSASEKDIRQAYKKLSRKFHPDKNKKPGAEDKFVEIAHGEFSDLS
jgi:DnaJ-class molecular chaperone with C-terminal Zn finger domain